MSFLDTQANAVVLFGESASRILLAGTVTKGDAIGFSSGWKRALATVGTAIPMKCVAGEDGVAGQFILAYFGTCLISGARFSGATAGASLYVAEGTDEGKYTQTQPSTTGDVTSAIGTMISSGVALLTPNYPTIEPVNALLGSLGASAWVIANDTSAAIKTFATSLQNLGHPVWVCDGTADEIEINAAVVAAAGGHVYLHKGTYKTAAEVLIDDDNTILQGSGFETIIQPQSAMTNSFNVTAEYCKIQDIAFDGNSKATQVRSYGSYLTYSHIKSTGHTTYNLNLPKGRGLVHVTNSSFFIGKPVYCGAAAVTFDGGTYFNGNGTDICLIIDGDFSHPVNVVGCAMESFAGAAITIGVADTCWIVNIIGNYFETDYTCTNIITGGAHWGMGTIQGNIVPTHPLVTNFVTLALGQNIEIFGNKCDLPIVVSTAVAGCRIVHYHDKISYNTLTGLPSLQKSYNEPTVLRYTAAPTTGTWAVGDRVWKTAPAAGGAPGWVCTTAGTPGTWKDMASLGA